MISLKNSPKSPVEDHIERNRIQDHIAKKSLNESYSLDDIVTEDQFKKDQNNNAPGIKEDKLGMSNTNQPQIIIEEIYNETMKRGINNEPLTKKMPYAKKLEVTPNAVIRNKFIKRINKRLDFVDMKRDMMVFDNRPDLRDCCFILPSEKMKKELRSGNKI